MVEKLVDARFLDAAAGVHDDDAVGDFGHDAEVVGDEDECGAEPLLQVGDAANKWTDILIGRQEIYTALTIEAIAEDFFDWTLIQSLGCESIANLPIVVGGQTIGAFNLLHEAGYYTAERLARVPEIMPFATLAYLAHIRAESAAQ